VRLAVVSHVLPAPRDAGRREKGQVSMCVEEREQGEQAYAVNTRSALCSDYHGAVCSLPPR
jgi:hypothetical protein